MVEGIILENKSSEEEGCVRNRAAVRRENFKHTHNILQTPKRACLSECNKSSIPRKLHWKFRKPLMSEFPIPEQIEDCLWPTQRADKNSQTEADLKPFTMMERTVICRSSLYSLKGLRTRVFLEFAIMSNLVFFGLFVFKYIITQCRSC